MDEPWHPDSLNIERMPDGSWLETLAGSQPGGVCDFCTDPHPVTDYPSGDFLIGTLVFTNPDTGRVETQDHWNRGGFLACQGCTILIDQGGYPQLVRRMVDRWKRRHPGLDADPDSFIAIIAGFAKHRQGPGRAWPGGGGAAG